jgi:hypothetical protein
MFQKQSHQLLEVEEGCYTLRNDILSTSRLCNFGKWEERRRVKVKKVKLPLCLPI